MGKEWKGDDKKSDRKTERRMVGGKKKSFFGVVIWSPKKC